MNKNKSFFSLLCSLGQSPMIIPEAILALNKNYNITFNEVHIITTDNSNLDQHYKVLDEIFKQLTFIERWTLSAVKNLPNISETDEYLYFEEILYHWYIAYANERLPYVCVSGGIKLMPSMLQYIARLFGAQDIFHVVFNGPAQTNPKDFNEVKKAIANNKINVISIGFEPGWKYLKYLFYNRLHNNLIIEEEKPNFYKIGLRNSQNNFLSKELKTIVKRISTGKHEKYHLPFHNLVLLDDDILEWLHQPLNIETDKEWIKNLPKIDLHCHLGGFATSGYILEQVRKAALYPEKLPSLVNIQYPEHWPLPENPIGLKEYMKLGKNTGSTLLKDPGCLVKHVELLYQNLVNNNVKYAEIRCSPDNYSSEQWSSWEVLEKIIDTFDRCINQTEEKKRTYVNLIIIVTRKSSGDLSSISRHIALAVSAAQHFNKKKICKIIGVDLAGYEEKDTRAVYFSQDFVDVHRCGLFVTAHAGENDDPEGVWQALFKLNAMRLGHALNIKDAPGLYKSIIDRRIGVEMCPYANYQIKGYYPMKHIEKKYPLLDYLNDGVLVTVNTDNIGISNASLTDNFLFLKHLCPSIKRIDILKLIKNSIEVAFITNYERINLTKNFNDLIFFNTIDFFTNIN